MTDPEQVPVSEMLDRIIKTVADLEDLAAWWRQTPLRDIAAIPEPEWEPTDDMRAKYRRSHPVIDDVDGFVPSDDYVDRHLRALHREGLL